MRIVYIYTVTSKILFRSDNNNFLLDISKKKKKLIFEQQVQGHI